MGMPDYVKIDVPFPDDVICCDEDTRIALASLWVNPDEMHKIKDLNYYDSVSIPTDLIVGRTIPLQHLVLDAYDQKTVIHVDLEDEHVVMINEIGLMVFVLKEDGGWQVAMNKGLMNNPNLLDDPETSQDVAMYAHLLLEIWYGIQIALIHPQLRILFKNPAKEKVYLRQGKGKDRKRVVKYVRKHYITAEGIDEALYGKGHKDFERKTMAWYVIGHWRQYKNGTRKFINGYWKGPLREMKRNLDGGRIRQLAI